MGWQGEQIRQDPLDAEKKRWNMEVVSWAPRAFLFHNFLTEEECDHMIKMATPSMTKSTVVDNKTGKSVPSSIRTSSGTFFRKHQDSVIAEVERKIAEASMVPAENGEGLQILHYDVGQKYESHYDFFHDKFNNDPSKGGQRVATMLMYLSTPESGGETVFPASKIKPDRSGGQWSDCARRGASVKAKKGDALLFWSLTPDQKEDTTSLHASCPVIRGEKWSATKWMHVNGFALGDDWGGHPPGECKNYHDSCGMWASIGECKNNPDYMIGAGGVGGACRPACKECVKKGAFNKPS